MPICQPYALPRVHVSAGMSLAEFEAHVSGFYARLQRLQAGFAAREDRAVGIEMTERSVDTNFQTYDAAEVAAHYATLDYLTPCERVLFETYIPPGSAILDLGVGGGRTTSYLANRASRYVGVDYAAAMVKVCRGKFPGLEFVVADAANLSIFPDASSICGVLRSTASTTCFRNNPGKAALGTFTVFSKAGAS